MNVTVRPDDWGRNLNIWIFEEDLTNRITHVARIVEDSVRMDPVNETERVVPTLILPRELAKELAERILGKTALISDELLETLRVERARVEKLLDHVVTMDNRAGRRT